MCPQAAAGPVEFPDDERISGPKRFQAPEQGRALDRGHRDVLEDGGTPGVLQRGKLHRAVVWSPVEMRA